MHPISSFSQPLISGWIGEGNYGDELMALGLRALLLQDFGVQHVGYYQVGPFAISPEPLTGVSALRTPTNSFIEKVVSRLRIPRHDLLLFGGGSIFHSESSIAWKRNLLHRYRQFKKNKPAGAISISAGPFPTRNAEKQCAAFFKELDFIVCRDAESSDIASSMVSSKKVHLCGDMALLVPLFFSDTMPAREKRVSDLVGISFVKLKNDNGTFERHNHADSFLKIINGIVQSGKRVRLFTLYGSPSMDDEELNYFLKNNALHPGRVELHSFTGDVFQTLAQCNECSHFISMRLHGVVSAYMLGIPCISIAYNPKNNYFAHMVNGADVVSLDWKSSNLAGTVLEKLQILPTRTLGATNTMLSPAFIRKVMCDQISQAGHY